MTGPPLFAPSEIDNSPLEKAQVVFLPFCYEQGASFGTGSIEGPLHLLAASDALERIDEETLRDWTRLPIHTAAPLWPTGTPEKAVAEMKAATAAVLDAGRFPLILGGDHAVTIGPALAVAERFDDACVLQIDAHLDLRDEWNGSRYNHACVMRRVADEARLPFVQVGIRSFSAEEHQYVTEHALRPFYAHRIDQADNGWIADVVSRLGPRVYITIDLDGLDPSVIPGTGTPEPGGLRYRQLLALLAAVGARRRVIGADINELVKIPGTQVSEFTAARIAAKILVHCVMVAHR
ncbi:MAG: agmatinase [Desulfobacterales bacterium]|jgi:agmatinase|nr:agmatinase [Desulfobacteraceae bacterium]MDY0312888.1 agmatinase [Desulfobacterales bacterium]